MTRPRTPSPALRPGAQPREGTVRAVLRALGLRALGLRVALVPAEGAR